jgi:hypothetical protein
VNSPLSKILVASLLLTASAAALTSAGALAQDARAGAPEERARDCALLTPSRKFDEYGVVSDAGEKSRLERLAAALKAEDKETNAFIVGYAGRSGRAGEGLARADRAKQILTDESVFYNMRLNALDCGRRETPSTELWITPAGASPPRCSPTLDPTPAPAGGATTRRPPRRRSGRL